ncbi:CB1 cannabinoid receptor-interacting protein 1 isoform X2 [Bos indicus]|uniref:CB1 cannabinoid receptor-interacting protein 1 n=1 Tax=Bos indicus TaxID=9915 RepID=A0ABM4T4N2_BOSIN
MGDLAGLVRLSIALRIQPNDGPVFYKVDGQRFGQNRTIKLLTGSSYKVEVKIKPTTLQVENISIGGVVVPLELKSKEPDGDRIVYTGTYDTEGVAPTKSGERQPIQITMPADSLPAEPQRKPKNTGMGSLCLLQEIFPTQELNRGLLHCSLVLEQ